MRVRRGEKGEPALVMEKRGKMQSTKRLPLFHTPDDGCHPDLIKTCITLTLHSAHKIGHASGRDPKRGTVKRLELKARRGSSLLSGSTGAGIARECQPPSILYAASDPRRRASGSVLSIAHVPPRSNRFVHLLPSGHLCALRFRELHGRFWRNQRI